MIYVLIPCYNCVASIEATIKSVQDQTYFVNHPYRIVIIDNNSTDGLTELMESKDWEHLQYVRCSVQGVAPALNLGLAYALRDERTTHIARLDGTDTWLPSKIEDQIKYMDLLDLDVCGTSMRFWSDGQYTDVHYPWLHHRIREYLVCGSNPMAHPSVLIKKELLLFTGGYDQGYAGAEDHDLWVRSIDHFRFGNLQKILVNYSFDQKDRSDGDANARRSSMKLVNKCT
jgi:glycosyltransferase involved in cell wall biosynthesis